MGNTIILNSGPFVIDGDSKDVSDTHHTFGELYDHRILLFIALMKLKPEISYRALLHDDGTSYEGSFIAGMKLPTGDITYHIPNEFWPLLEPNITTLEKAPTFDGHTSFDVLERLQAYIESL